MPSREVLAPPSCADRPAYIPGADFNIRVCNDRAKTHRYFHEFVKVEHGLVHIGAARPRLETFVEDLERAEYRASTRSARAGRLPVRPDGKRMGHCRPA